MIRDQCPAIAGGRACKKVRKKMDSRERYNFQVEVSGAYTDFARLQVTVSAENVVVDEDQLIDALDTILVRANNILREKINDARLNQGFPEWIVRATQSAMPRHRRPEPVTTVTEAKPFLPTAETSEAGQTAPLVEDTVKEAGPDLGALTQSETEAPPAVAKTAQEATPDAVDSVSVEVLPDVVQQKPGQTTNNAETPLPTADAFGAGQTTPAVDNSVWASARLKAAQVEADSLDQEARETAHLPADNRLPQVSQIAGEILTPEPKPCPENTEAEKPAGKTSDDVTILMVQPGCDETTQVMNLGANFDSYMGTWFVMPGIDITPFMRWICEGSQQQKTYFANQLKQGRIWNDNSRKWE
jgi:hypothetical protein